MDAGMTITEFLTARLDEDEAVARACGDAPWELLPEARQVNVAAEAIRNEKWKYGRMGYVASFEHVENARHVALHDPARVLADVAAKRAIVAAWAAADAAAGPYPGTDAGVEMGLFEAIHHLASVYADHLDWREEWRP
jgi:hypothetical protein